MTHVRYTKDYYKATMLIVVPLLCFVILIGCAGTGEPLPYTAPTTIGEGTCPTISGVFKDIAIRSAPEQNYSMPLSLTVIADRYQKIRQIEHGYDWYHDQTTIKLEEQLSKLDQVFVKISTINGGQAYKFESFGDGQTLRMVTLSRGGAFDCVRGAIEFRTAYFGAYIFMWGVYKSYDSLWVSSEGHLVLAQREFHLEAFLVPLYVSEGLIGWQAWEPTSVSEPPGEAITSYERQPEIPWVWHTKNNNVLAYSEIGGKGESLEVPSHVDLELVRQQGDWGVFEYDARAGARGQGWILMRYVERKP